MWSRLILFGLAVTLLGCQEKQAVTLNTQGQADTRIVADQYHVQVAFKGIGETSQVATQVLSKKLKPFEEWVQKQSYKLDAGRHDNRPTYHYHPEQGRQLTGYEAYQTVDIRELSFDEYQMVISQVPAFKSDSVRLSSVSAGEDQKQHAKSELVSTAFTKARLQAESMADAANLCDLGVLRMEENMQPYGAPRMMKMEMDVSSVHEAQSQESLSLNLNVQWQAFACE